MHHDIVAPVCFDGGTGDLAVDYLDEAGVAVGGEGLLRQLMKSC